MKYIFIGGGRGGFELISSAISKNIFPAYSVICKEDDHENIKYSDKIVNLFKQNGIGYTVKKKLSETDHAIIRKIRPDIIFVYGWRTMIETELNSYCRYGIIAAHYSLLPKYRGFAPMQWAIINGDRNIGVTFFRIERGGVDSGSILIQKKLKLKKNEYANEVENKLIYVTVKTFLDLIRKKSLKQNSFISQDESKATYTCKRTPEDGKINWNSDSEKIYNLIRALAYPFTGAFCVHKGEKYVIRKAESGKMNKKSFTGRIAGRVIDIDEKGIEVLCGSGTIRLTEWQNSGTGNIEIPSVSVRSYSDTLL